jgi:hypothetical protein
MSIVTMIATKMIAMIAAMSVLGTVTPAAFADVFQSQIVINQATQNNVPVAVGDGATASDDNSQDIDQGACQNQAGADRGSAAVALQNVAGDDLDDVDCS